MNGVIEIKVGSVKHSLKFGMAANEVLTIKQIEHPGAGNIVLLTDLIYAGMHNHSTIKGLPIKSYEEVSEIVDDLLIQEDEQPELIWKCFSESKPGAKLLDNLKKKQEESQGQNL